MSDFDKRAYDGKCDVCGKETRVAVCASTMGPVSLSYCEECLRNAAEPYSFMVAFAACAGEWPDGISGEAQARIRKLLAFHGKTEEEFSQDVSACRKAGVLV